MRSILFLAATLLVVALLFPATFALSCYESSTGSDPTSPPVVCEAKYDRCLVTGSTTSLTMGIYRCYSQAACDILSDQATANPSFMVLIFV